MKKIIFLFILRIAISEWIEIVHISHVNESVITEIPSTTMKYEITMRAPQTKNNLTGIQTNQAKFSKIQEGTIPKKKPESKNDNDQFGEEDNTDTIDENVFFKFLKSIQNNILKYKSKTSRNKISALRHMRDTLLYNVHERIVNLWKPGNTEARGYKDDDYHMNFPSNEGALMTIGFLTFAVFLIKLVIKLVHLIKYKHHYAMNTSTTTAASIVFLKREGRYTDSSDQANILQYINELKN